MTNECKPVEVSRRIEAPAARIFQVLVNPQTHIEFDGSGMLRGALSSDVISGVGDVFSMKMYFEPLGDYVMINQVVEFDLIGVLVGNPRPATRRQARMVPSASVFQQGIGGATG